MLWLGLTLRGRINIWKEVINWERVGRKFRGNIKVKELGFVMLYKLTKVKVLELLVKWVEERIKSEDRNRGLYTVRKWKLILWE